MDTVRQPRFIPQPIAYPNDKFYIIDTRQPDVVYDLIAKIRANGKLINFRGIALAQLASKNEPSSILIDYQYIQPFWVQRNDKFRTEDGKILLVKEVFYSLPFGNYTILSENGGRYNLSELNSMEHII